MPAKTPYARIAITLPAADLASADRLATLHDRSRSWIIAEAIRRFAAVESQATPVAAHDLGLSRQTQLLRDLALTPEQRVAAAEETGRMAIPVGEPRTFGSYDEFQAWLRTGQRP
jgi:hypothetical protein